MPSIFAAQVPATNDSGAVTLGFEGAPNVLYDRTLVGGATYTLSTAGTTGGETLSLTLRGPYPYSFTSSVPINWPEFTAPVPQCSATAFDRIRFEVLQDGSLLGVPQALAASAASALSLTPLTATHGTPWTAVLSGLTPGDGLYVESSDDTAITVTTTSAVAASLSATFTYAGAPVIAVQQTPPGGGAAAATQTFTMTVT